MGSPLLLASLCVTVGVLCVLLFLGGTLALAALLALVLVAFLIGFLNL